MTTEVTIKPTPDRIRCTGCPSDTSGWLLENALVTLEWTLVNGHWFCSKCRSAAPWIVALDRERNAHQVTRLRLEAMLEAAAAEATSTYEAMRAEIEALRCGDLVACADGELTPERRDAFQWHLSRCAECQRELELQVQLGATLADLRSP